MAADYNDSWEEISTDATANLTTYRLRVPGGWLVCVRDTSGNDQSTTVFVNDPTQNWKIAQLRARVFETMFI